MAKEKMCFSCRQGDIDDVPADYYVTGSFEGRPFRGNLCRDHYEMYLEDGLKVSNEKPLS